MLAPKMLSKIYLAIQEISYILNYMKQEINEILKQEIIAYAKENGYLKAQQKYGIWIDTIKYWTDPSFKKRKQESAKSFYQEQIINNPDLLEKKKIREKSEAQQRSEYMKEYRKKHKEKLLSRAEQHRQANLEQYKQKAHDRYIKTS
jgi:predicted GIY-YIG superfamily endonuclease